MGPTVGTSAFDLEWSVASPNVVGAPGGTVTNQTNYTSPTFNIPDGETNGYVQFYIRDNDGGSPSDFEYFVTFHVVGGNNARWAGSSEGDGEYVSKSTAVTTYGYLGFSSTVVANRST